ncbi:Cobalamin synthase [hydrothermal vent metagenome]|uniref:Adenosylcobinamide-GDP ribazoletransferase n=1 Tax=hydrothermal vent metagenome TaxID=652676 RepID=A0A1W1CYJ5_9ZZZZ
MFSYFSVLPVHFGKDDNLSTPTVLASMLFFLPLGGLVLGSIALLLFSLLEPLGWLAALVAGVAYMMLYGFLHTEAIMDVADALYAKHSGKDAYEIIKEPTVGAMGVLWAGCMVLLKVGGIVFLLLHGAYALFLSVLIVSRLGLLLLFFTQTFRSSFITQMQEGFSQTYFVTSLLLFTLIGFTLSNLYFLVLLVIGLLFSYLLATLLRKNLGFINGDVLGTTLESTEIVLFILGAVLWL